MNHSQKYYRGATLLEVMLVLSVAAMIIVMSVRYYQTAVSNQQADALLTQVQAIANAADQLALATTSYADVTDAKIKPLVPPLTQTTAWGTNISVGNTSKSSYTLSVDTPAGVCPLVVGKLLVNRHFTSSNTCNGTGTSALEFVYSASPN